MCTASKQAKTKANATQDYYALPNDYRKGQVCRKLCLAEVPTSEFWPKTFLVVVVVVVIVVVVVTELINTKLVCVPINIMVTNYVSNLGFLTCFYPGSYRSTTPLSQMFRP